MEVSVEEVSLVATREVLVEEDVSLVLEGENFGCGGWRGAENGKDTRTCYNYGEVGYKERLFMTLNCTASPHFGHYANMAHASEGLHKCTYVGE